MAFAPTITAVGIGPSGALANMYTGVTSPTLHTAASTATASGYSNNSGRFEIINATAGDTYALYYQYTLSCEL